MKKNIVFVLVFLLAALAGVTWAVSFKDLPANHWAYPAVDRLVNQYHVMSGFPSGNFGGKKILTRFEFAKSLVATLSYIETSKEVDLKITPAKKVYFKDVKPKHWAYKDVISLAGNYQIIKGFPDWTFRGKKTLTRIEVAVSLAKALDRLETVSGLTAPTTEVYLKDMPKKHWAYKSVNHLIAVGIMTPYLDRTFRGKEPVNRYLLAILLDRFITYAMEKGIATVPPPPPPLAPLPPEPLSLEKARVTLAGSLGNIYEPASGTNTVPNVGLSLAYLNSYQLFSLSGHYELRAAYSLGRVNYLVPGTGGVINGGIVNESRYDLDVNSIYPFFNWWGVTGNLLLGVKYLNLSNTSSPTDFTGLNAGLVTILPLLNNDFVIRGFYSLPLARRTASPSVLGAPAQLFDYEAATATNLLGQPVYVGLNGEIMLLSGGSSRYYNSVFVRYFLL